MECYSTVGAASSCCWQTKFNEYLLFFRDLHSELMDFAAGKSNDPKGSIHQRLDTDTGDYDSSQERKYMF